MLRDPAIRRAARMALAAAALCAFAVWFWAFAIRHHEREISRQLFAALREFNGASAERSEAADRAGRIAQYFMPDVTIDFGFGSAPIRGRETLVGIATRILPRTSAFVGELVDTHIRVLDGVHADVTLTLLFRSRAPGEHDLEARELSISLQNAERSWRIQHIKIVDALR
jgi:hypothetical protein